MKDERDMVLIRYLACLDLLKESNADIILLEKDLMVLEEKIPWPLNGTFE